MGLFHHKILGLVTIIYFIMFFFHFIYFVSKKEGILRTIWWGIYINFGLHTCGIILRWIDSYRLNMGHAPFTNLFESLIFFSWCISLIMLLMKKRLVYPIITMLGVLGALFLMAYASLSPDVDKTIRPLIPALKSNWLHVHVITCFISYAAFLISFICGILHLIRFKWILLPEKVVLEEINYKSVIIGFPMLTAGILTGAVWAHYAWGSYWSWDPKETWSLITWIIYALFLHVRFVKGWKGKKIALISIIGFLSVLFTYFGVNFILSGLHSYAV